MLQKVESVSIHHRNMQNLAIKINNVKNELAPTITANVFTTITENHYNLLNYNGFRLPFARTVYHSTKSILYLGPKTWDTFLKELKNFQSFASFKKPKRKWTPNNYPCRLCKRYADGADFL